MVAENCSTGEPTALMPLHPVQLVSIEAVPGAIENVGLLGSALTPPPAHPANTTNAGPSSAARTRDRSTAGIRICSLLKEADGPRVGDIFDTI
jgi:hypothetical protein